MRWTTKRKEKTIALYLSGKTINQIADCLSTSGRHIASVLNEANIPRRKHSDYRDSYVAAARKRPKRENKIWTPTRDRVVAEMYLSDALQKEIAEYFGTTQSRVSASLIRSGIQLPRTGRRNPAWLGGRKLDKDGYVLIYEPNNPMATSQGYVREHRLSMAAKLGRPLTRLEVVHHNKGRRDNKAKDLRLFPTNGEHLRYELTGKIPKWTPKGHARLLAAARKPRKRSPKNRRPT